MKSVELPTIIAGAADSAQHFSVLPVEDPDGVIRNIRNKQETLLGIGRKGHAAGRAAIACLRGQEELLDELAFLGGDIDAVGTPVGCVDQSIVGNIQREVVPEL